MRIPFLSDLTYWLASAVVMIRMIVTPIPIRPLLLLFHFSEGPISFVLLGEILTIEAVFVVVPVVIVVVGAIVEPVVVLIVAMVFFLAPIVLTPGRGHHCRWSGNGCSKQKGTEKVSMATVHVVFLLA
jgi:hypothetical protein